MRALTVLYHDVIAADFDESGFPGPAAARYKFKRDEFEAHLEAMRARSTSPAVATTPAALGVNAQPFFFTIDDGGSSAVYIAAALDRIGWRGTFFITTDRIGSKAFVSAEEIRALHRAGHTIGSHSCSHPYRMAGLPHVRLDDEWRRSAAVLFDILGEKIETASVPGGFYAPRVAKAASAAGIRVLFNSEPTTRVYREDACLIVGRYNVYGGMSAAGAGKLAAADPLELLKQQAIWTIKKTIKTAAAPVWDQTRKRIFKS